MDIASISVPQTVLRLAETVDKNSRLDLSRGCTDLVILLNFNG